MWYANLFSVFMWIWSSGEQMSKGFCLFEDKVRFHFSVWTSTTFHHDSHVTSKVRQKTVKINATLQKSNNVISWHNIKESNIWFLSLFFIFELQSFTDRDYLIAGEYPLPGSSIDLCRLLVDYESAIVVFVNGLSEIPSVS